MKAKIAVTACVAVVALLGGCLAPALGPDSKPALGSEAGSQSGGAAVVVGVLGQIEAAIPEGPGSTLYHILLILSIMIAAGLIMKLVKVINRWLVYTNWGPLKYLFQSHQRSMTINTLALNLLKYVVYFTAIGLILQDIGIDYRVYLTSISLIGVAIGFGSQGLVQDVVTGFFILFESQIAVGNMAEIGGQVGIVEEIGLRTTSIRNYLNEHVTFSNRNIGVIGVFALGGVEAAVDVPLPALDQEKRLRELLGELAARLQAQFREIVLSWKTVEQTVIHERGEMSVRQVYRIWPGQQWVVETQFLPRLKEAIDREGLTCRTDRIAVFYHLPFKKKTVRGPGRRRPPQGSGAREKRSSTRPAER